ncbi:MAG: DUF1684 domain-containing protein [Verrucomicrobiales bacterium]|nr:DUF1684 domain-containing protein [Verrucomicrobiales bacterium]
MSANRHRAFCQGFVRLLIVGLSALVFGCQTRPPSSASAGAGPADWLAWQAKRRESIAGTNGWTTLVARHWLTEGATTVGSHSMNSVVLPEGRAPSTVGRFVRTGRVVRFEAGPGVEARVLGEPVRESILQSDVDGHPTVLRVGDLSFVVIERGERLGLRVRDPQSPDRIHFAGLRYFPYDPKWRIEGYFEAYSSSRPLRVGDVSGGTQEFSAPGELVFRHGGKEHRLIAVDELGEDDFFVIFRDATNGRSTYDPGRFLYVGKPKSDGRVTIDFNRAYTPPCGFTRYATCPLAPEQNALPFGVKAGERKPASHH